MNKIFAFLVAFCLSLTYSAAKGKLQDERVVVAYVTSWSQVMPDPFCMTHINYAFGGVNKAFNGVDISNPGRLRAIVRLKAQNPSLRVMLSIGGWGSGRFSEMVTDPHLRQLFCEDCRRIVDDYGLDGIDIDWEYPGNPGGGISYAPTDKDNFSLLMRDLRQALGTDRLLTLATAATGGFYDFPAFVEYVDFVNMMTYDMGSAPRHHAPLFNSGRFEGTCCQKALQAHLDQGVPARKLTLGMPFYGRGTNEVGNFCDYSRIIELTQFHKQWDKEARVPYLTDDEGRVVMGFDDARSLKIKCRYARKQGLKGVMYWDYNGDDSQGTLRKCVWKAMR